MVGTTKELVFCSPFVCQPKLKKIRFGAISLLLEILKDINDSNSNFPEIFCLFPNLNGKKCRSFVTQSETT